MSQQRVNNMLANNNEEEESAIIHLKKAPHGVKQTTEKHHLGRKAKYA